MDVRTLRIQRGLTLDQLATLLGMRSRGRLSEMERGEKPVPVHLALKIETWSGGLISASSLNSDVAAVETARRRVRTKAAA